MAIGTCQCQNVPAASLLSGFATLIDTGDNILLGNNDINLEGGVAVNPNSTPTSVITITIADL